MGSMERHVQRPGGKAEHLRRMPRDHERLDRGRQRLPRHLLIHAEPLQATVQIDGDAVEIAPPVGAVLPPPGRKATIVDDPLEPEAREHLSGGLDIGRGDPEVAVQVGAGRVVGVPDSQRRALQEDGAKADGFEGSQDLGRGGVDPEVAGDGRDAGRRLSVGGTCHVAHCTSAKREVPAGASHSGYGRLGDPDLYGLAEGVVRSNKTASTVPAARAEGLLVQTLGDETVIYDTEAKEAHCLKPLAAVVFHSSDGHATVGELARTAEARLGSAVSDADVADAVAQLESVGLLQTALVVRAGNGVVATNGRGVSRREMLRRVGFAGATAAVGTSLVTSIVPPNAFALSGIPAGCTGCTQNKDCISNHCCQSTPGKSCNQTCCAGSRNSCHVTSCRCGGTGDLCTTRASCPGGQDCICICTVCNTEVAGGECPVCPSGSTTCCTGRVLECTAPLLDDPEPTPTPTPPA